MRLVAAALLALASATGVAGADEAPPGWEAALADAAPVKVDVRPVEISGGDLAQGMSVKGAWVLSGDHRAFGSFSGLVVRGPRLMAVTDYGWWLDAQLTGSGPELRLRNVRLAPMRGPKGERYDKQGGDAEALALTRQGVAVAFERDHRVMRLGSDGRLGSTVKSAGIVRLRPNKGLEALAPLGDGMIVLAEGSVGPVVPVFLVDAIGAVQEGVLARAGRHSVTGADIGPDGRLYLVLRHYLPILGASIRVLRYALDADGWPLADTIEELAAFESASGIDNMEGISVEAAEDGGLHIWLISDDNFNPLQRSLLMLLALDAQI